MALKREVVLEVLRSLSNFLKPLLPLANAHMVHFLTDDYWSTLLSPGIRKDLLDLNDEELAKLPEDFLEYESGNCRHLGPSLNQLLNQFYEHSLLFSSIVSDIQDVWHQLKIEPLQWSVHFDQFMKDKKKHEVGVLCGVVSSLASHSRSRMIIDLGCGKGALGSMVSLNQGLFVWGIDAAGYDAHNEAQRQSRLEKTYLAAARKTNTTTNEETIGRISLNFHRSVCYIEENTNLTDLKSKCQLDLKDAELSNLGITGLHTCGNLAPTSLRLFIQSPETKFICNVGCCYHLLDEYFVDSDKVDGTRGFPMSSMLRTDAFSLGRNARMMSAQPLERYASEKKLQPDVLFYRALLQVILMEKLDQPRSKEQFHVGRLRKPVYSFEEYARWALKRLNINIPMTSEELQDYEQKYLDDKKLMTAFFQLRLLVAPLVESLILVDRFAYLLEQDCVSSAFLVRLFSPVTSPRCYGLIALKED